LKAIKRSLTFVTLFIYQFICSILFTDNEILSIGSDSNEDVLVLPSVDPRAIQQTELVAGTITDHDIIGIHDEKTGEMETIDIDNESDNVNMEPAHSKEEVCRLLIERIRHEEFGCNVSLSDEGKSLVAKHQERLGRSLERLSKDLYSKDTHFVLELIQNADDNNYPTEMFQ